MENEQIIAITLFCSFKRFIPLYQIVSILLGSSQVSQVSRAVVQAFNKRYKQLTSWYFVGSFLQALFSTWQYATFLLTANGTITFSYKLFLFQCYLHYKTIFCYKVALDA